ncbi:hypothetical protein FA15DRAFT_753052 [Coprinopsis marcescibilis]|uniref:Uncharacterized protein n=1 Tax=Coprinopsis marcescibilis TaxID=230819 RepID=A0A5C3LAD6_COPMA|nr:hypothetical protein FA15DRAFT_753052 [Coprinopsis marcescibilis]
MSLSPTALKPLITAKLANRLSSESGTRNKAGCVQTRQIGTQRTMEGSDIDDLESPIGEHGQNESVQPGPPDPSPSHLALFILCDAPNERKALIPVPLSYQEAQQAAFTVLKPYMPSVERASEISLRPSLTGKMEDCGEIEAKYWKLAFPLCKVVGVFRGVFLDGLLWVTLWESSGWTRIRTNSHRASATPLMERPSTYKEALKSLENVIERNTWWKQDRLQAEDRLSYGLYSHGPYGIPSSQSVICYSFFGPTTSRFSTRDPTSTEEFNLMDNDSWTRLPESAHTDDEQWRRLVPLSGQIIGFKFVS